MGEGLGRGFGQRVRIDEDGRGDPALAQSDTLAEVGDGQRIGAMRHEGGAQLGGAVAVAVGLDDGEDLPLGARRSGGRRGRCGRRRRDRSRGWWASWPEDTRNVQTRHSLRRPVRANVLRHGTRYLSGGAVRAGPIGQAAGRNQSRQLPARHVRSESRPSRAVSAPDLARELGRRLGVPVEFSKFETAGELGRRREAPARGTWRFSAPSRSGRPRSRSPRPISRSRRPTSCPPARRSARSPTSTRRACGSRWRAERVRAVPDPQHQARQAGHDQGHRRLVQAFVTTEARGAGGAAAAAA